MTLPLESISRSWAHALACRRPGVECSGLTSGRIACASVSPGTEGLGDRYGVRRFTGRPGRLLTDLLAVQPLRSGGEVGVGGAFAAVPRFIGAGFAVVDKVTRYKRWEQIFDHKNVALGIVVAGMFIAIGQIAAAAIHG